jgi:hypothetical protein
VASKVSGCTVCNVFKMILLSWDLTPCSVAAIYRFVARTYSFNLKGKIIIFFSENQVGTFLRNFIKILPHCTASNSRRSNLQSPPWECPVLNAMACGWISVMDHLTITADVDVTADSKNLFRSFRLRLAWKMEGIKCGHWFRLLLID